MRALPALLAAAALAACSDRAAPEAEAPANETRSAAEPAPAASPAAPSGAARPLGDGRGLTGSVSGLTGTVTAFQVEVTDTQTIVELAADVLFAFDSDRLAAGAPEQLARTAELIRQGAPGPVPVVGYTDSKGEDAYNDDLSLRRARAVAEWLETSGGIEPGRLRPEGRGEREPVAPDTHPGGADDPAARARNRRVVVSIPR